MADWYVSSAAWTAIPQFAASTAYTVGQIVRPLTAPAFNANYTFRCTTAGTSSTEPTWPANNTSTVTTGGATFTNVSGQSTYGWGAAAGTLYSMGSNAPGTGRFFPGDRVFLSSDHSESSASGNYAPESGGAAYGVIEVPSVSRAGSVPPAATDALAGAAITFTSGIILDNMVNKYWQGITFTLAGAGGSFAFGNNGAKGHYFKNCAFVLTTSSTTAFFNTNNPTRVTFDNTTVTFNAAGQRFALSSPSYPIDFAWINTPSALSGTVPTVLFALSGNAGATSVTCRGVDLSAVTTTLVGIAGAPIWGKVLLDSCRIASAVVRYATTSVISAADEIELVNCYDGTSFLAERHTPAGDLTTEFTITLSGGAQDNVGVFSHKMVSSSRSDKFAMPLEGFWLDVNNASVGGSHTATVEIVSSASLNNDDIWLVLEYQGTTSSSLASFVTSQPTNALATAAAVPTSSATWNSPPGTPVYQHLQVTFTPRVAGRVRGQVRLGKISTTVWVNPQVTIT